MTEIKVDSETDSTCSSLPSSLPSSRRRGSTKSAQWIVAVHVLHNFWVCQKTQQLTTLASLPLRLQKNSMEECVLETA